MRILERDIEAYFVKCLKDINVMTRKAKWLGYDGCPDRFVLACGGIWVELKAPGKKPRANQITAMAQLSLAGAQVRLIDSYGGVDELVNYIWALRGYESNAKKIYATSLPKIDNQQDNHES